MLPSFAVMKKGRPGLVMKTIYGNGQARETIARELSTRREPKKWQAIRK